MGNIMFRERKTLEAASYILQKIPETPETEYLKVVKLLYLADRELMKKRGRTISGDRMNALKNGPILSTTLDRLEGESKDWAEYISNPGCYKVKLEKAVAPAALNQAEIAALEITLAEHGSKTWEELIDYTHTLPEWIAKGINGTKRWAIIQFSELAEALGYNDEEAKAIERLERNRYENSTVMETLGVKPRHV
jgi:uncharacterized phage-associated protein